MTTNLSETNIIALLQESAEYLDSCGVSDARAEADILLAHALGLTRDRLYLDHTQVIRPEQFLMFQELLSKRASREPLAYLLGQREFMGLDFTVNGNVLIPRPETELLVEKALETGNTILKQNKEYWKNEFLKTETLSVLDLCTGSGAIAVSIAHFKPEWPVTAVDISADALKVAAVNAAKMKVNVNFCRGDLYQPVYGQKYDIIVSNPPYISEEEYSACMEEVKKEPTIALLAGTDGLDFYRRIALDARNHLEQNGVVMVEIGCSQAQAVSELFSQNGFAVEILRDYSGLDRIIIAKS